MIPLNRNKWTACSGIGGRHAPESVDGLLRNQWSPSTGLRTYVKSNVFLEGYIRWQTLDNTKEWQSYMYQISGETSIGENGHYSDSDLKIIQDALFKIGIEVVDLNVWPGYIAQDIEEIHQFKEKIVDRLLQYNGATRDYDQLADPERKASPESEVLQIINKEREGCYHMLAEEGKVSDAWFISDTSMLNSVVVGNRITWLPEAFLRFASTLFPVLDAQATEQAFEILLLELAKSGLNLLDEIIIEDVFSGIIDQAELSVTEQRLIYRQTISNKYGEDPNLVDLRIMKIYSPLAAIQISNEMTQIADERLKQSETFGQKTKAELDKVNLELSKLGKYRIRLQRREFEKAQNKKKGKNKSKKK